MNGVGRRRTLTASSTAVFVGMCLMLWAAGSSAWQAAAAPKALADRIKRDAARCKTTQNLETCDDAVRWDPSDPALLVAFGDALMRAKHPAEALRQYQRAVALAPRISGVSAKISAAEARLPPKSAPTRLAQTRSAAVAAANSNAAAKPPAARNSAAAAESGYSNDAAESRSH